MDNNPFKIKFSKNTLIHKVWVNMEKLVEKGLTNYIGVYIYHHIGYAFLCKNTTCN